MIPKDMAPLDDDDKATINVIHELIDAVIAATRSTIDYADQVIADSTAGDLEDGDVD